jgi:hypothetical protein
MGFSIPVSRRPTSLVTTWLITTWLITTRLITRTTCPPARLHSLVQEILVRLLDDLGYEAGHEVTIKLDPDYELIPDVIAAEGDIGDPYPTEPFEIAIEILSPEDR